MTMFSLTEDSRGQSISIFYADGESETIPEAHVSFKPIIEKLLSGKANDEEIRELTSVLQTIAVKMSALSERVSVDGKNVYFDGDPLAGELTEVIKSLFAEGSTDFKPLVNFLEKAKTNPSLKSIDDLYRWITNGDLVIDPEGDIIAYKGVHIDDNGVSVSIHAGKAFVNGEEVVGKIPNKPGTVISMARSQVNDNEFAHCSYGLHAGTYAYANSFRDWSSNNGSRVVLVKINPRDVVSVPNDHSSAKMRVSRYTVLTQIEERLASAVYQPELPVDDEDDEIDWDALTDAEQFEIDPERYEDENGIEDEDEDEDWEEDEDDEEEEVSQTDAIRDALGRFTPAAGRLMQRDSNGRFVS